MSWLLSVSLISNQDSHKLGLYQGTSLNKKRDNNLENVYRLTNNRQRPRKNKKGDLEVTIEKVTQMQIRLN